MAVKTFSVGETLTASDTNTYLANSGLVYLNTYSMSGVSTKQCTSAFSSSYTNYRAIIRVTCSALQSIYIRYLIGTTSQTDNIYCIEQRTQYSTATQTIATRGDQYGLCGFGTTTYYTNLVVEFMSPQVASYSTYTVNGSAARGATDNDLFSITAQNRVTTQYDGFELVTVAAPTMTGDVTLYGYRKA